MQSHSYASGSNDDRWCLSFHRRSERALSRSVSEKNKSTEHTSKYQHKASAFEVTKTKRNLEIELTIVQEPTREKQQTKKKSEHSCNNKAIVIHNFAEERCKAKDEAHVCTPQVGHAELVSQSSRLDNCNSNEQKLQRTTTQKVRGEVQGGVSEVWE